MKRKRFFFEINEYEQVLTCFVLCIQKKDKDKCKELIGPFSIDEAQEWDAHNQTPDCEHEFLYPNIGYSKGQ